MGQVLLQGKDLRSLALIAVEIQVIAVGEEERLAITLARVNTMAVIEFGILLSVHASSMLVFWL